LRLLIRIQETLTIAPERSNSLPHPQKKWNKRMVKFFQELLPMRKLTFLGFYLKEIQRTKPRNKQKGIRFNQDKCLNFSLLPSYYPTHGFPLLSYAHQLSFVPLP
jgi:hypothetical protein